MHDKFLFYLLSLRFLPPQVFLKFPKHQNLLYILALQKKLLRDFVQPNYKSHLVLLLELLALGLLIGIEASLVMVRLVHGGRVVNRRELLGTLVEERVHDVG